MSWTDADRGFMAQAIELAKGRMGETWPNPAVGCVLVKDGRIIAQAATAPGGRPHAEEQAVPPRRRADSLSQEMSAGFAA